MGITKLLHINRDTSAGGSTHLQDALNYIMKPEKTEQGLLIGGGNCLFSIPDIAYENMMQTKQIWGKQEGRQAYHYVISLDKGEGNSEVMMDIMERFCREYLGDDYEYVYTVHTDREHMHGHVIFNSVSRINGKKYRYKQGDWQRYIQPITNRLCERHGLSTIRLGREFDFSIGDWKEAMRNDMEECRSCSVSYDDFLQHLKSIGYTVHDSPKHKYLTLVPPGKGEDGFRGHRTDRLGEKYGKAALKEYFNSNPKPAAEIPVSKMSEKQNEKVEKWKNITFSKYEFYMPTKEIRRLFVDYKKQRRELRTVYDRRAFLYKKDVKQLKNTMERQRYLLDHGLTSTELVQERYQFVRSLCRIANKEYAQIRAEMAGRREEYELYEEYVSYRTLEDMYVNSNQDRQLYEYHKRYLDILSKIDESPYTLQDFESLEGLKQEKARCLQNVKALQGEKKLLSEILKDNQKKEMQHEKKTDR